MCLALVALCACSPAQPREKLDAGRQVQPDSSPVIAPTPTPEPELPRYLMPILTPLRDFLHALNVAVIGGILVLYLALLLILLSKRR